MVSLCIDRTVTKTPSTHKALALIPSTDIPGLWYTPADASPWELEQEDQELSYLASSRSVWDRDLVSKASNQQQKSQDEEKYT